MESKITAPNGDEFSVEQDLMEATSLHRPDTSWVFTDKAGHQHRWYVATLGVPATSYRPQEAYSTPTLKWVKDGERYWPDGDGPYDVGHHECVDCGERIEPRYTTDTTKQYVPGLRRCYINGQPVSTEEFEQRVKAEFRDSFS